MKENVLPQVKVNLKNCARCGESHLGMIFTELKNPKDEYKWWGMCSTSKQPILLAQKHIIDEVKRAKE